MIGYAFCGSFCTFEQSFEALKELKKHYEDILPIMSFNAYSTDTRFGKSGDWVRRIEQVCGNRVISTIVDAEPLGPKVSLDALIVAPCTGNTLAKLANGITDTPVCMAAKAHLRSDRPLILALASNDAMSANLGNLGALLSRKNIYFVPMLQDDIVSKPHSLVADMTRVSICFEAMKEKNQIRPLFL
jgi:dipicolinate synthase subunit B